jgi:hypothetical protein
MANSQVRVVGIWGVGEGRVGMVIYASKLSVTVRKNFSSMRVYARSLELYQRQNLRFMRVEARSLEVP